MSFFKNLGDELGTGSGKGIVALITALWKIFCLFIIWLVSWQHQEGMSDWKRNSLRIAVGSFLIACLTVPGLTRFNLSPSAETTASTKPTQEVPHDAQLDVVSIGSYDGVHQKPPGEDSERVEVYVQLPGNTPSLVFPAEAYFKEIPDDDVQYYHIINDIPYFQYQLKKDLKPPQITVDKSLCAIVPAGRSIRFASVRPPIFTANMKNKVMFLMDIAKMPHRMRIAVFFNPNPPEWEFKKEESWWSLVKQWDKVDHSYVFIAEASEAKDIPYPRLGGLVCF